MEDWGVGTPGALLLFGCIGVSLRVLRGGRIHPDDEVPYEQFSGAAVDIASMTLEWHLTRHLKQEITMNNHKLLLGMAKWTIERKLTMMDDRLSNSHIILGRVGWRDFSPLSILHTIRLSIKKAGEASTWMHDVCSLGNYPIGAVRSAAERIFLD
ncbi:hypothetical protein F5X96DRAFT_667961 [Biscogniauxia mediterranea]|nr:hypothetical protein F5X96DRAFT_667961 [Biscogniauxia mediterranea]